MNRRMLTIRSIPASPTAWKWQSPKTQRGNVGRGRCNPATQNPETGKPNVGTTNTLADAAPPKMEFFDMEKLEVARANTLSDDEKTNRLHTITKDAAAEIAKKAAF